MKKMAFILSIVLSFSLNAAEVPNPVAHFASLGEPPADLQARYAQIGFKQINVDLNGDSKMDMLLCFDDPDSQDATDIQSQAQEPGILRWDVYVKNEANTAYIVSNGIEIDGQISIAFGLPLNPETVFIGQITEINRFGIVTMEIANPREGPSMSTIYAYTWEGDHLKRQKLAEYETEQDNATFDKYLAEDKRTALQVHQVTPN